MCVQLNPTISNSHGKQKMAKNQRSEIADNKGLRDKHKVCSNTKEIEITRSELVGPNFTYLKYFYLNK